MSAPDGEKYSDVLARTRGTLMDNVKTTQKLLSYLQNEAVLNNTMVDQIMCRPSRSEKAKLLVDYLSVLGPQSYHSFVAALKHTQQDHLAKVLAAHVIIS